MPTPSRPHPPALPHGDIREIFDGVYFVTGTLALGGPVPMRFSRNMTIFRERGDRLVLVNTVRLGDRGLAALDALGKVTDIVRIAGNHGMDDPFYRDRYQAKVWALAGQRYTAGLGASAAPAYFEPDVAIDERTELPLANARIYRIHSQPPEGLLVLERHGGTVVAGDCLQNWAEADAYFSFLGKTVMKLTGFLQPHNVGPAWLKQTKPPKHELRGILDLEFANLLPAHGVPVLGGARDHYRLAVARASGTTR